MIPVIIICKDIIYVPVKQIYAPETSVVKAIYPSFVSFLNENR
jgi:hypothetical protein